MKKYFFILFFLTNTMLCYATHNRAGEIVYRQIGNFSYEITIYTYTYTKSDADRDSLEVQWGDNTKSYIHRIRKRPLPDDYQQNVYVTSHTFPGIGTYVIVMQDPNRNEGIRNIPNSVNVVFAIKTILQINPVIGTNSTPVLLNMPIDKAAINKRFVHNPAAFDPDGDSLSYKLATCLYEGGKPIPDYKLPEASKKISVDPITGDLVWETPVVMGKYNVAMEIEEWRKGVKISSIIRDIQIEVEDSNNKQPEIEDLAKSCVIADSTVQFTVKATDPDNENVTLTAVGGLFTLTNNPAEFKQPVTGRGSVSSIFKWQTNCQHVRKQPYSAIFRAEDDNPELKLVDYEDFSILVISPPPIITKTVSTNSTVSLVWKPCKCTNITGYKIYRKNALDDFIPDFCETGVPNDIGYTLIKEITNPKDTTFTDDNNGKGLAQGYTYCYRIVATFSDGALSYSSPKNCIELKKGVPLVIKAVITKTDEKKGTLHFEWIKPLEFDSIANSGPYKYLIFFSRDMRGLNYTDPYEVFGLNNTKLTDTFNTKIYPSIYKMGLYNYDANAQNWRIIGIPEVATSVFLVPTAADRKVILNMNFDVPWTNDTFVIYKENPNTSNFDSIGYSTTNHYVDKNLENGKTYCYKVKTIGHYSSKSLPNPIINFSQIACATPIDTVPPCPIKFEVISDCKNFNNKISWQLENTECTEGLAKINIYFSNKMDGEKQLVKTITDLNTNQFIHIPDNSLAGCYTISAIDSSGNENINKQDICVDNCTYYELPNVFTPNQDIYNELYHPILNKYVTKVDMKIYNRWGNLVFKTDNPEINWDGKDMNTGKLVPDGIYYYYCDVYETRLTGLEERNITGFINVSGSEKSIKQ